MGLDQKVRLPSGEMRSIADNQIPYHLNCPIDGTQLAERGEYDYTGYDCVTCRESYSVRKGRISQEELERQARDILKRTVERALELDSERNNLLRILELAKQNSFE